MEGQEFRGHFCLQSKFKASYIKSSRKVRYRMKLCLRKEKTRLHSSGHKGGNT